MSIKSMEYTDLINDLACLGEKQLKDILEDVNEARRQIKNSKISMIKKRILFLNIDQLDELFEHIKSIKTPYIDDDDEDWM